MKYYIETSKGIITFESDYIEKLKVIHDYWQTSSDEFIFKNCKFDNIDVLNEIYRWGKVYVIKNKVVFKIM